jgi:hypothetical protein
MGAKPDKSLRLNTMGRHVKWGSVKERPTRHWWTSARGEASSLTLGDGTCFAVDFTGASGSDVMLMTTGKAEGQAVKLDGKVLTFYFATAQMPPEVTVKGDAAVVGRQKVTMVNENLALAVTGR